MIRSCLSSRKLIFFAVVLICCLIVAALQAVAQPDKILVNNNRDYSKKKKPAVNFPHGQHMENFDCLECHHLFQKGENVLDAGELEEGSPGVRCRDCHGRKNFKFSEDQDATRRGLMQAYHKQCISCHRSQKGPRNCNQCHKK